VRPLPRSWSRPQTGAEIAAFQKQFSDLRRGNICRPGPRHPLRPFYR